MSKYRIGLYLMKIPFSIYRNEELKRDLDTMKINNIQLEEENEQMKVEMEKKVEEIDILK